MSIHKLACTLHSISEFFIVKSHHSTVIASLLNLSIFTLFKVKVQDTSLTGVIHRFV
ncbi:hypothetical protein J5751_06220 [bacterium]|nr:hypothetical protein [bacterium]